MSQIVYFKLFYELVNTILEQQDISPERDKTGVNYLMVRSGYDSGLTLLIDADGRPIVTKYFTLVA